MSEASLRWGSVVSLNGGAAAYLLGRGDDLRASGGECRPIPRPHSSGGSGVTGSARPAPGGLDRRSKPLETPWKHWTRLDRGGASNRPDLALQSHQRRIADMLGKL